MATTNFSALMPDQKLVWAKDTWKMARNASFINQFAGSSANSMVHRVTELTKDQKGSRAMVHLIADLENDGIAGDAKLEDNEEAIKAYFSEIRIDQLRNANRLSGRMADQKSVVEFRKNSRDVLAYWLADRMDQMAFLTLSGVDYTQTNRGAARPVLAAGKNLSDLEYAADVTPPTTNRILRWDATGGLSTDGNANLAVDDTLSYKALVELKAFAKDNYIRGIKSKGGEEVYHVFVTPQGMAKLKLDPDYLANVRNAGVRGGSNPLFAGTTSVMVDGLIVHEYRHVYNTAGAAGGSKWGAAGAVDGQRVLFCGAQALAMADIGDPMWVEETFDYGNQHGISVGKIFGFKKPKFHSNVTAAIEDFGVIALDTAL